MSKAKCKSKLFLLNYISIITLICICKTYVNKPCYYLALIDKWKTNVQDRDGTAENVGVTKCCPAQSALKLCNYYEQV